MRFYTYTCKHKWFLALLKVGVILHFLKSVIDTGWRLSVKQGGNSDCNREKNERHTGRDLDNGAMISYYLREYPILLRAVRTKRDREIDYGFFG